MARAPRPLSTQRLAPNLASLVAICGCLALFNRGPSYTAPPPASRAPARSDLHTRANLPRQVLELKDPEPEQVKEKEVLPPRRVPYKLLYQSDTTGLAQKGHHLSDANYEYMVSKVQNALEPLEDWVVSVELRMHIDHHEHSHLPKITKANAHPALHEPRARGTSYEVLDEDSPVDAPTMELNHKRMLAPYRLDVTLHMKQGMIAVSGDRHARASFTEAVDHVHDLLRMKLKKEKEKRIHLKRRAMAQEAQAVTDWSTAWDELDELAESRAAMEAKMAEERATMERLEWMAAH